MTLDRKELGRRGEVLARRYLDKQGYTILDTNFRCSYGEIDIVAQEGEQLVFVEVKTRRSHAFGIPEESITQSKKDKLLEVAQAYLQIHAGLPEEWRIDVVTISITHPNAPPKIELVRNAVFE